MEISQSPSAQPTPVRNEQSAPPEPQRQTSLESSAEVSPEPASRSSTPSGNVGQNVDTYA